MQRAMWMAFKGSFQKALKMVLSVNDPFAVMRRSRKRYAENLAGIPDFP